MKKILICGPRPKAEMTGVALAVELLLVGLREHRMPHACVDATFMNRQAKSGSFSLLRAIETILVVLRVWLRLPNSGIYYATMSTSTFGFIRDYLTVGVAQLLRRRTVLHLHGGGFEDFYQSSHPFLQRLIRANLKRTDTIIVLGELLKEQFYCAGDFVKSKLVVVPNGLTLGVDEPVPIQRTVPKDTSIQLLYLSSLMESKGYLDVIRATKRLNQDFPGRYHLHLCGGFVDATTEGDRMLSNHEELQHFLKAENLLDQVTYHGQVTGSDKIERFNAAHVFLLPTNYPWEGQPLSIIEAEAYSLPVVSCSHKGIPEQVEDGVSGRLIKKNAAAIAEAVQDICASEVIYRKYANASRLHYERGFKREVHLDRLMVTIIGS